MKYRSLIAILSITLLLSSCGATKEEKKIDFNNIESNEYSPVKVDQEIGSFNLLTPAFGSIFDQSPTFTWEAAKNATTYTLEICEDETFIEDVSYIEYYKQTNLTSTSFKIQSELRNKNVDYYWRVTAYNDGKGSKVCEKVFTFYYKAPEIEEASFDVGEADDWLLHPYGSYADIAIDRTNFFGNNKNALSVTFKKEDTNQGIPSSDGWIVVTKTVEKSIYGTDSLMFNMFYAGNDSVIKIRLVDRDNEYWYHQISVSNNAKQTVFLKFSDFIQRLNDVPVSNRKFDYERIKYMEIVFEKTFGDGVFLLSDVKAVKYSNYKDRFIDKLHFDQYQESAWVYENYNFTKTIKGDELKLDFTNINGYGFAKLGVSKNFASGDAVKVSVKYSGVKGNNIILRIYEEDLDRWMYKVPYSTLTLDEYLTVVIPFKAFGKSAFEGDGKRQFSFINNLQFGLEGAYGTGSISFKDFEIVKTEDYKTEEKRVVNEDGMIENFNKYVSSTELFFIWDVTDVNKDEYMTLETEHAIGTGKKQCAKFEYKSDMEEAVYMLETKVGNFDFKAMNLKLKDNGVKDKPTKADVFIQLATGEQYVYCIEKMSRYWTEYNIPFTSFKRYNGTGGMDITPEAIVGIAIGLQYFNAPNPPAYTDGNSIFIDDICFTSVNSYSEKEIEKIIRPEGDYASIDNFESYQNTDELLSNWFNVSSHGYEQMSLADDVSSEGGKHSINMQYKRSEASISYAMSTTIDSSVAAKGITIDIKGDTKVTIYLNLYVLIGSSTLQYRYTFNLVSDVWKSYSIGFSNFTEITTTGTSMLSKYVPNITKLTFGAVYWGDSSDHSLSSFYIDNYKFDNTLSYTTKTERTIA